jgi:ribosomal protein L11 methyltransferase
MAENWFEIDLKCDSITALELLSCIVLDWGADGTFIDEPNLCLKIYSKELFVKDILENSKEFSVVTLSIKAVEENDWLKNCSKFFEPIALSSLNIVSHSFLPTILPPKELNTINIIPGYGFGTGHHPTTKLLLEILSSQNIVNKYVAQEDLDIVDVGTGSGILAIACAKIFNCKVLAIDNDPLALVNAKDNLVLNQVTSLVNLQEAELSNIQNRSFDLIVANLYAEILVDLESTFFDRLKSSGSLLLSGILCQKIEIVLNSFVKANYGRWCILDKIEEDGWIALSLKLAGEK